MCQPENAQSAQNQTGLCIQVCMHGALHWFFDAKEPVMFEVQRSGYGGSKYLTYRPDWLEGAGSFGPKPLESMWRQSRYPVPGSSPHVG